MKKKLLTYGLVAVLSVSMLAGCGSKKNSEKSGHKVDKTFMEVAENVVKSIEDIDSMKLGVKADIDMTAQSEGVEMLVKGAAELNGTFNIDVPAFNADGKVSYELSASGQKFSGEYTMTSYGETVDDTMNIYAKTNITDWEMESVDVSEYIESMEMIKSQVNEVASQISEIDSKEIEDTVGKYLKLEDETKYVNDRECYVLSADLDVNDLKELVELTESKQESEAFTDSVEDMNFSYGICIDTKTYIPVKVYMNITAKGNDGDTEFSINKMGFEFNFTANSGKVKDVPKDVKEEAESGDTDAKEAIDSFLGSGGIVPGIGDDDYGIDVDGDNDNTNNDKNDKEEPDSDSKDYGTVDTKYIPKSFTLEGKEYQMGSKVGVLLDAGFAIDTEWTDFDKIEGQGTKTVYLKSTKNDDYGFSLAVQNDTDSAIEIKDAPIYGITIDVDSELSFELDNGIQLGDNISEVQKIYKGQKSSYEYDGSAISSVEYQDEDYNEVDYTYDMDDNRVTEITLYYSK